MSIVEIVLAILLLPPSYLHGGVEKSIILSTPNNAAELHVSRVRDAYVVKIMKDESAEERTIYLSGYNGNKGLLIKTNGGEVRVDNYQDVLGLVVDKKDKRVHFYPFSDKELRQGKRSSTNKGVMRLQGNEVVIQYRGVEKRLLISTAETQQSEPGGVAKDGTSDQIRLKDEGILTGAIKTDKVPFKSSFGKIEIKIEDILNFADGKLSLADGTVLKGAFVKGELEIATTVGTLEVSVGDIVAIERGGTTPTKTGMGQVPPEAVKALEDKAQAWIESFDGWTATSFNIWPVGAGKLLPMDKARGREKVYCLHMVWIWNKENNRREQNNYNTVMYKRGNQWEIPIFGASEETWLSSSCPGEYMKYR